MQVLILAFLSVQSGFLPNYSTQQIAITGTILRPKYIYLKRTGIGQILPGVFCCKSIIDSGLPAGTTSDDKTPNAKADGRVEDGSILTGDGSELRSTVRLVECAMLAATAGLAYFLSNLLRIEVNCCVIQGMYKDSVLLSASAQNKNRKYALEANSRFY